jgi:uncharacterized LabA/DUF88 family protein
VSNVALYVDGFNLYFGLRSKKWRKYYWLDLVALGNRLLTPGQTLVAAHYFTSRIRIDGNNAADVARQSDYLDALAARGGLTIHFGHFLEKDRHCNSCGAKWKSFEEKMTDVNIAVQILADAVDGVYDTAIVVSGDSDLTPPVLEVRRRYPTKRVIIALPPNRRSNELQTAATGYFPINEVAYRNSRLPDPVQGANGVLLHCPPTWK